MKKELLPPLHNVEAELELLLRKMGYSGLDVYLTTRCDYLTANGKVNKVEWRGEWDSNPRVLSDMGLAIPRPTRLGDPRPQEHYKVTLY